MATSTIKKTLNFPHYSSSSNEFSYWGQGSDSHTITKTGWYVVTLHGKWTPTRFSVNGLSVIQSQLIGDSTNTYANVIVMPIPLNEGDEVTITSAYSDCGGVLAYFY